MISLLRGASVSLMCANDGQTEDDALKHVVMRETVSHWVQLFWRGKVPTARFGQQTEYNPLNVKITLYM